MKNKKSILFSLIFLFISFYLVNMFYQKTQTDKIVNPSNLNSILEKKHSPFIGNKNAKVTIVEWLDPQCVACKAFHPIVNDILKKHNNDVNLLVRHLANHKDSLFMIKILNAANEQNLYKEVLDLMFNYYDILSSSTNPRPEFIWEYLKDIKGLDLIKLKNDFKKDIYIKNLEIDEQDALILGIRGTPTFYVNSIKLNDFSPEGLKTLVEKEINKGKK